MRTITRFPTNELMNQLTNKLLCKLIIIVVTFYAETTLGRVFDIEVMI